MTFPIDSDSVPIDAAQVTVVGTGIPAEWKNRKPESGWSVGKVEVDDPNR